MDYDFSDLEKAIKAIGEVCGIIVDAFKELLDSLKPGLLKAYEMLQEVEYEEKVRFKPILEIKPNKINYPNKRLRNYYCRNNC